VYHLMRWFPAWAGWLPHHEPTITLASPGTSSAEPASSAAT
jgi:cardiolipin synthase